MISRLDELTATTAGKAETCARLRRAGFPVPDGFVLDPTEDGSALSTELDAWHESARFAVRSSALDEDGRASSFAGVHETILDVGRDAVPAAVQRCLESLHGRRALVYRLRHCLETHDLRMKVLVQRMIVPVVAGVAFTAVAGGEEPRIRVNGAWGHGEAIASGRIDPDDIVLDARTGAVVRARIGRKRLRASCRDGHVTLTENLRADSRRLCLSRSRLTELCELLWAVHRFFDAPQDVEWCHDGEQFWIVQSRPRTDLSTQPGPAYVARDCDAVEWTRANRVEVLPDVGSPQAVEANARLLDQTMRRWYGALLGPADGLGPCVRRFCGRAVFNLSRLRALCRSTGADESVVLREMGHQTLAHPQRSSPPPVFIGNLGRLIRLAARQVWDCATMGHWFARLDARVRTLQKTLPASCDDAACSRVIASYEPLARASIHRTFSLGSLTAFKMLLKGVLSRAGVDADGYLNARLGVGEKSVSARQGLDLVKLAAAAREEPRVRRWFSSVHRRATWDDLAGWRDALAGTRFAEAFDDFLGCYGHRGVHESDWSLPRYADDPTPLLFAVALMTIGDDALDRLHSAGTAPATAMPPVTAAVAACLVAVVRRGLQLRERHRSEFVRVEGAYRRWHLAVADRFVARGWMDARDDYFLLYLGEVRGALEGRLAPAAIAGIVARRRREQQVWRDLRLPLCGTAARFADALAAQSEPGIRLDEQVTPADEVPWAADRVQGASVSSGQAEGEVVVVSAPEEFARMRPGAILVAPAADPSWIPLFTLASAVVLEVGGSLSHAATVLREYGLPAVASIPAATRVLRDGDRVRVDGATGWVERVALGVDDARAAGG